MNYFSQFFIDNQHETTKNLIGHCIFIIKDWKQFFKLNKQISMEISNSILKYKSKNFIHKMKFHSNNLNSNKNNNNKNPNNKILRMELKGIIMPFLIIIIILLLVLPLPLIISLALKMTNK